MIMAKSKVCFADLRSTGKSVLDKLSRLVESAGMSSIDFREKFVAIKIHFGEPGNLAYIRPPFAARIAQLVREKGGNPFLTDANTLYKGRRSNAVDHLRAASENGFNALSAGCDVIIADGLRGTDYREIHVGTKHCPTAKIGAAIADADIVVSLTHFKGHEMTGFGGVLKNLGMGSGSIGGKLEMHSDSKPSITREKCVSCGACWKNCAHDAIHADGERKAVIDYDRCVGCGQCIAMCRYDAAIPTWNAVSAQEKIAEYALAAVKGKPSFHVSFLMNVSPDCDCWGHNDTAIVPDLGIAASFDPVALDRACLDMVSAAPALKGSALEGRGAPGLDKFRILHPAVDGTAGLAYAEQIGLGTQDYELVIVT
jgi:uncharacterized Fe-S center protein